MTKRLMLLTLAGVMVTTVAHAEILIPPLPHRLSSNLTEARAEAQASYKQAAEALNDGKLKEAKLHAKIAYATLPNASTAALLCIALRELDEKKAAFKYCLVGLSLKPTSEEKRQLNSTIRELGREVSMGWAHVQLDPPDATVTIGKSAFQGSRVVGLSPGDYTFKVTRPGYKPRSMDVGISAGVQVPAIVGLSQIITTDTKVRLNTEPTWMTYAGWGAVGVGGALVVGAVAYQIVGLLKKDGLSDEEANEKYNVPTAIMGTLGGVFAVTGIIMVVLDPGETTEVAVDEARLRYIGPTFSRHGVSLNLDMTF